MEETFNQYSESLTPLFVEYGMSIIGAVLILFIGWTIAGWASRKVVKKARTSEKIDETLIPILGQTVRILLIVVTILAVLNQFGVETASIIAVLGASALAIGLALQGTLSNVAAGAMLLILRPFKVGDAVSIGGTTGVVDSIGLFTTEMHTFDNIGVSMPNSRVWGNEIQNLNAFDTRRVDMEFGISYDDDMDKAIKIIKDILDEDERVLDEPEPLLAIGNLGDSSVVIRVRPWANTPDVWPLRYDITKKVKEEFDKNHVTFPFPQRDVHMFNEN
jgi:small conductance mechanosensitive channel